MRVSLLDQLHYRELADRGARVEGSVSDEQCVRLKGLVGEAGQLDLQTTVSPQGAGVRLEGHVGGQITLTCRRCLGSVDWQVDQPLNLQIVGTEEAMQALADDVDAHHAPALVGRLLDVLEEEVLLALPDFPEHPPGQCSATALPDGVVVTDEQAVAERVQQQQTQRPFAVLQSLKKTRQDD
jgi:uncharacterized protein